MKIIIDCKLENLNEMISSNRTNKYIGATHKRKEMNLIKWFLRGVPKIDKYPIKLNCTWHVKNINSDLDNKILKNVLDAMQEVGILENDNISHIREINNIAIKGKKDYLEMEIEEIDGNN